jgi:hypothetical protein
MRTSDTGATPGSPTATLEPLRWPGSACGCGGAARLSRKYLGPMLGWAKAGYFEQSEFEEAGLKAAAARPTAAGCLPREHKAPMDPKVRQLRVHTINAASERGPPGALTEPVEPVTPQVAPRTGRTPKLTSGLPTPIRRGRACWCPHPTRPLPSSSPFPVILSRRLRCPWSAGCEWSPRLSQETVPCGCHLRRASQ